MLTIECFKRMYIYFMIYLPYSTFHSLIIHCWHWWAINGTWGAVLMLCLLRLLKLKKCSCVQLLFVWFLTSLVTMLLVFCFLHTQNHLDSMQVFSSYFSSKFCFSSPCDSFGVVPVTAFSCPVNYCTAHPWLICKHLINSFDLYRHRSNYWTFLIQTISLHSHFIRTWLKLFMCFINVQSKIGHVLLAFKSKQLLFIKKKKRML